VSLDDRIRISLVPWSDKGVSFRGYVSSRVRHDLNHIEQIRVALTC